jgi:hypothetical protein
MEIPDDTETRIDAAPVLQRPSLPQVNSPPPIAAEPVLADMLESPVAEHAELPPAARIAQPNHSKPRENGPQLNLREYSARLVGHRMGVRRVEVRLLDMTSATEDELAALVGELERLASQAEFLRLYADLLPVEPEATPGRPVPASGAAATLQRLIALRIAALAGDAHDRGTLAEEGERERLAGLADRMQRLAEAESRRATLP